MRRYDKEFPQDAGNAVAAVNFARNTGKLPSSWETFWYFQILHIEMRRALLGVDGPLAWCGDRYVGMFVKPADAALAVSAVNAGGDGKGAEPVPAWWQYRYRKSVNTPWSSWHIVKRRKVAEINAGEFGEVEALYAAPVAIRPEPAGEVEKLADEAWLDLCEKDRTSPEDSPTKALITADDIGVFLDAFDARGRDLDQANARADEARRLIDEKNAEIARLKEELETTHRERNAAQFSEDTLAKSVLEGIAKFEARATAAETARDAALERVRVRALCERLGEAAARALADVKEAL